MTHVIVVKRGGLIKTLYTDKLPLARFGRLTIRRGANVEWDNDRQGWMVELADGRILPGCWPSRDAALRAEIAAVNATL